MLQTHHTTTTGCCSCLFGSYECAQSRPNASTARCSSHRVDQHAKMLTYSSKYICFVPCLIRLPPLIHIALLLPCYSAAIHYTTCTPNHRTQQTNSLESLTSVHHPYSPLCTPCLIQAPVSQQLQRLQSFQHLRARRPFSTSKMRILRTLPTFQVQLPLQVTLMIRHP